MKFTRALACIAVVASPFWVPATVNAATSLTAQPATYALGKAKSCVPHYVKKTEQHNVKERVKVKGKFKMVIVSKRYVACMYVAPPAIVITSPPVPLVIPQPIVTTTTLAPVVTTTTLPFLAQPAPPDPPVAPPTTTTTTTLPPTTTTVPETTTTTEPPTTTTTIPPPTTTTTTTIPSGVVSMNWNGGSVRAGSSPITSWSADPPSNPMTIGPGLSLRVAAYASGSVSSDPFPLGILDVTVTSSEVSTQTNVGGFGSSDCSGLQNFSTQAVGTCLFTFSGNPTTYVITFTYSSTDPIYANDGETLTLTVNIT